jgi:hypothetical protein
MNLDWKSAVMKRRLAAVASSCLVASIAIGCQKEGEIARYSVPREVSDKAPHPVEPQSGELQTATAEGRKERMLAAIIARNGRVWFFKLVGPEGPVAEQTEPFRKFVESVNFAEEGTIPEWKLPEGWRQQPGSGMRHASIAINTPKQPLELTVTPLKTGTGDFEDYVLANVDRWRQQLGLPPTSRARLFGPAERSGELIEVKRRDGEIALIVDLAGEHGSNAASGLAGSSPPPPVGLASTGSADDRPGNGPPLTYEAPSGWSPGKVDGLRQVAFEIGDGSKKAEVTVIALAASAGDLLANVNRWREQVHLGPVAREELERQLKEFQVNDVKGHGVELVGPAYAQPREGILGVICSHREKAWFFKMKGDAELVERERGRFESFVHSVKFEGSNGAHDGH